MPSKDTIPFHITKNTASELERIRKVIAKELGIDIESITKKHAEITLRIKASRGKVLQKELKEVMMGKIK